METRRTLVIATIGVLLAISLAITGFPAQTLPPRPAAAQQAASEKVIVGLLKDDGTIMPFSRYDGLHWTGCCAPPDDPESLPTHPLRQIPKEWRVPSTWRLWLPLPSYGGSFPIHVTGLQPRKVEDNNNCHEGGWGFGTDFPTQLSLNN